MPTTTYAVTGMTCEHCVKAVTDELSALDGVSAVEVFLVSGGESTVQVTSVDTLDRAAVADAIDEAGYDLV